MIHGTTATNGQLKINWPNGGILKGDTEPGIDDRSGAQGDLTLIVRCAWQRQPPRANARGGGCARGLPRIARLGYG